MHRIATSSHYRVDPHTVRTEWTWLEVMEANVLLDAFDKVEG